MAKSEKRHRRKEHEDADLKALMGRLGKNVLKLRKSRRDEKGKNLSQQVLATNAGIALSSLVDIERGGANIRLSTILAVAKALDVTPIDLLK